MACQDEAAKTFTQADINALKKAIALGATRVRYADRDVEYRSLAEMRETLGMMQAELSGSQGKRRGRRVIFQPSRGL